MIRSTRLFLISALVLGGLACGDDGAPVGDSSTTLDSTGGDSSSADSSGGDSSAGDSSGQ